MFVCFGGGPLKTSPFVNTVTPQTLCLSWGQVAGQQKDLSESPAVMILAHSGTYP